MLNHETLNEHLIIYRYKQGIKLLASEEDAASFDHATGHTVGEILALPFNFYFLNTEGKTELMNEESAFRCGFKSSEDALGKSLVDVSNQESAKKLLDNCEEVIQQEALRTFDEENIRQDGMSLNFLSIKCPWYDHHSHLMGVFGCSIVLGAHQLADSLSAIVHLGLFDSSQIPLAKPLKINKTNLSKREIECLHLTIKGYTAKRIARELAISHRTVEEYLLNIRIKLGASSKSELIEMTIDQFIGGLG